MQITNFRQLNQEVGVMTAYIDVGNSNHVKKLAIVKKWDGHWRFEHDGCKLDKTANDYCDQEAEKCLNKQEG
jgi:hypothetical protein